MVISSKKYDYCYYVCVCKYKYVFEVRFFYLIKYMEGFGFLKSGYVFKFMLKEIDICYILLFFININILLKFVM